MLTGTTQRNRAMAMLDTLIHMASQYFPILCITIGLLGIVLLAFTD